MKCNMIFYRYEAREYAVLGMDGDYESSPFPNPKLELREFVLKKETPKGYWIGSEHWNLGQRWIPKVSKKRYAYPTKEEAMINFIKRTEKRVGILKRQLWSSEISLRNAITMEKTKKEFSDDTK